MELAAVHLVEFLEQVLRQHENVLAPLAQRRDVDGHNLQPVVQVVPEPAHVHLAEQDLVGRGDEPDVAGLFLHRADPAKAAAVQQGQQLGLHRRLQLPDLVEEDRALVGDLRQPDLLRDGARERASLVAEKLGLHQAARNGRAVDFGEGMAGAMGWIGSPEIIRLLEMDGATPVGVSSEQFRHRVASDLSMWKRIADEHRITME